MKILIFNILLITNIIAYQTGDTISLSVSSHLGLKENKTYIVDFFASWCPSCKKEIPLISKVNTNIDKKHFEIIGIDVDKDINKGLHFQQTLKNEGKLNFRVINDPQNLIIKEFNPIGMPTLYYIKNNKILGIIIGAVDNIDLKIIDDLKTMK